jgi:signal transduction histidine kinase/methylmalonyl-CoA mutase cobalamin-binding subunit
VPKRILHLDDDPGAAVLLRGQLDAIPRFDCELRRVASREELASIRLADFHIAFVGDRFAGAETADVLDELRDAGFVRPIVVLGAGADPELAVHLIHRGADDYLAKATLEARRLARAMSDADCRYLRRKLEQDLEEKTAELSVTLHRETQALRDLEAAKARAEAASRAKSAFLANMSHEIRTPLTAILGYADELRSESLDEAARREAIDVIHENGEFLLRIVSDILDLSKIEAGRLEVERIPVGPAKIVAEACRFLEPRARAKGIVLRHAVHDGVPGVVLSDPTRLRQILLNLIGNAVKFTKMGSVSVEARLEPGDRLEIAVADTGIGLTGEEIDRIFEAFAQADPSTTRRHGGTGLGLAICDRLARLLGGSIRAESTPGRGSTFRLTVPCGGPVTEADEAAEPGEDASRGGTGELRIPRCRILLAEDHDMNRKLVRAILERLGATVVDAANGREAVERAAEASRAGRAIDLALMDLQMPELDGFGATRALRAAGFAAPIVALTGNATESDRRECLEAGFDDFASKPVRKDRLVEIITARLGSNAPIERSPR